MAIDPMSLIGGGLSLAGSLFGASAAGDAAAAQERQAAAQLKFAKETQDRALAEAKSPEEFAQLEKAAQFQERQLARTERLIQSLDPAILEAANQATNILKGEDADSLGPARQERARQREQLLNQLREQLGPGAETSSVGQQALQRFDQETATTLQGMQQQSLSQLLNIGMSGENVGRATLQDQLGVAQGFGNRASRASQALIGGQQAVTATGKQAVGAAGSQFVGQQIAGTGISSLGNQLLKGSFAQQKPAATKGGQGTGDLGKFLLSNDSSSMVG